MTQPIIKRRMITRDRKGKRYERAELRVWCGRRETPYSFLVNTETWVATPYEPARFRSGKATAPKWLRAIVATWSAAELQQIAHETEARLPLRYRLMAQLEIVRWEMSEVYDWRTICRRAVRNAPTVARKKRKRLYQQRICDALSQVILHDEQY